MTQVAIGFLRLNRSTITLNTEREYFLSPHILVLLNISCMIYLKCDILKNLPTTVVRYYPTIDLFFLLLLCYLRKVARRPWQRISPSHSLDILEDS